jgi:hypothetical protein
MTEKLNKMMDCPRGCLHDPWNGSFECPRCHGFNKKRCIFVFGSNLAGIHGAGSAKAALDKYGAVYHQGVGPQGLSYAIPTKDERIRTLPLSVVNNYVLQFIDYAKKNPELDFYVVKIGCGLAGFNEDEISPMFVGAPDNCYLPEDW